jgi:pimeloyl-ACP methyl ester carboxylesterase
LFRPIDPSGAAAIAGSVTMVGSDDEIARRGSASSGSVTGWRSHEAMGRDDNRLRLRRRLVGLPNHHVEPREDESLSSAARPTPPKRTTLIAVDVKCPVLALYGGADQSIPQELIEKRQAALQGGRQDL